MSKEVVKNTKFKKLNTKVNLIQKIPDATTLLHINQYNTEKKEKKKLEKKNWKC